MSAPSVVPPPPPLGYRVILRFFRAVLRLYFREVEVTGLEHVPLDRGGVLVSWHPNGLIDPALLLTHFPRQVVFGARHGLFKVPLLGTLLRNIGTVPIYRAIDAKGAAGEEARREANARSLDALAGEVARGSFSALFPEGVSHDRPHPVELKTGAARLYYRAQELQPAGANRPEIVPVGLHYDKKSLFRSRALIWFHPPLPLSPELAPAIPGEPADALKERARRVTEQLEQELHEVVHATDDWELHQLIHRGRKLMRAERASRAGSAPGAPGIEEQALGFARIRAGYYRRLQDAPEQVQEVKLRVSRYDADLRALGLEDHELDRDPRLASPWLALLLVLQALLVFLLLPPLTLVGLLVNGPTALALWLVSRLGAKLEKDQATIKLLGGMLAFPATWAGAGLLAAAAHPWLRSVFPSLPESALLGGLLVALLGAAGGAVGLRYLNLAAETVRAVRVRRTRRRYRESVERLRAERAAIAAEVERLSAGLDLLGVVAPDGTVRPAG